MLIYPNLANLTLALPIHSRGKNLETYIPWSHPDYEYLQGGQGEQGGKGGHRPRTPDGSSSARAQEVIEISFRRVTRARTHRHKRSQASNTGTCVTQ